MKRILIVSTNYFPNVGGAEVAIREITNRLRRKNGETNDQFIFQMIVPKITRGLPFIETIDEVIVYRVGLGIVLDKFYFPLFGTILGLLLHGKYHFNTIWCMMASQASISAAFLKIVIHRIRLVLTLQEGDEEDHLKRYVFNIDWIYRIFVRPWHLLVFRVADVITVISEYLSSRARSNNFSGPIISVPNGVDINHFSQQFSQNEKITLRQAWGNEKDIFLITVSRLVKKNAVDIIIQSLIHLPDNIKLCVVGVGPDESKLKRLVADHALESRVLFLGWSDIGHKKLPLYLQSADIFIRPSRSEGQGISFLEAMASGVPVIATKVGGIPDFIFDPIDNAEGKKPTGVFANVDDPEDLAKKVTYLIKNPEIKEQIITNARELISAKYDWGMLAEEMGKVF